MMKGCNIMSTFRLIAGEDIKTSQKKYTEEEIREKMDEAFISNDGQTFLYWANIYFDHYGVFFHSTL